MCLNRLFIIFCFLTTSLNAFSQDRYGIEKNKQIERLNLEGYDRLENGMKRVEINSSTPLERDSIEIVITATNKSSIYIAEVNEKGFLVKATEGDINTPFHWKIEFNVPKEVFNSSIDKRQIK